MTPLRVGLLLAALVAGPSLWSLVHSGTLGQSDALLRGSVVAVLCVVGAGWLLQLVEEYAEQAAQRERVDQLLAAIEAAEAEKEEQDRARTGEGE